MNNKLIEHMANQFKNRTFEQVKAEWRQQATYLLEELFNDRQSRRAIWNRDEEYKDYLLDELHRLTDSAFIEGHQFAWSGWAQTALEKEETAKQNAFEAQKKLRRTLKGDV